MDYKLLLDTAVLAGELMLKSGAEIFRVEGTIHHILKVSGLKTAHAYATITGIMVTLDDPSIDSLTVVRRINERCNDLNTIDQVNTISRDFCSGKIDLKTAFYKLKHLQRQTYSIGIWILSVVVCCATFAILFGGSALDFCIAALDGLILAFALRLGQRIGLNDFLQQLGSSIIIAVVAILISRIPNLVIHINPIIIGVIMPLVPGAAITNAVRDTLQGDYTAGGAKALEAFVTATAIAVGVGVGFLLTGGWQ